MGQKYVPELHDPESRTPEGQGVELLTDKEIDQRFDALVAALDAQARMTQQRKTR